MDRFLILSTITERSLANHICGALEDANIAVMLEHAEVIDGSVRLSAYRLLVPADSAQIARRLLDVATDVFKARHPLSDVRDWMM